MALSGQTHTDYCDFKLYLFIYFFPVMNCWKLSFALGVNLKNLADFCKCEAKSSFRLRKRWCRL